MGAERTGPAGTGRTRHLLQLNAAGNPPTATRYGDPVVRETIGRTAAGWRPDVLHVEVISRVEVAR